MRVLEGSKEQETNSLPTTGREKNGNVNTMKKKAKSRVNEANNYTKPSLRKSLFNKIKAGTKGGDKGEWSARKAQLLASQYKKAGGGYKD